MGGSRPHPPKHMNKKSELDSVIGRIIFNTIRPYVQLTPQNYHELWDDVQREVELAYNCGFANGLNTTYESPYKCGECEGDDLCFDSNVQWDRTTRQWAIKWKETSEAYCWHCDQQVTVYQKLMGDYDND